MRNFSILDYRSMSLTHDDVQGILKMIDAAEHLDEIEIVQGSFRLHVVRGARRDMQRAPATPPPTAATPAPAPEIEIPTPEANPSSVAVPPGTVALRAPMLGTFYRAPAPGEKPFVEIGQQVQADDTVCLIEVMKLFNSIRAGVGGTIVKILPDNGSLVEADEPLIFIAPKKS